MKTKTELKYLNVGDKTIPYIILNKNNKNTYFRFKEGYLEISKAKYTTIKNALDFVNINFDSFYQKYLKSLTSIPSSNEVILEDKSYSLEVVNKKGFKYQISDNKIIAYSNLSVDRIKYFIYEHHLKQMINKIISEINIVLRTNNINPLPIKFGIYKSKYGSYHRIRKEITLNVALAKGNINYLYYVIMHEYAHTKVFNHSKAFYEVLNKLMPNYVKYHKTINKLSINL